MQLLIHLGGVDIEPWRGFVIELMQGSYLMILLAYS